MKKEKAELRKKRKLSEDDNFELATSALKIWNELRQRDTEKLRKEQLIDKLITLLKGNFKAFVRKHDTVRIMQSLVQYGTPAQRTIVFEELKDSMVELSKMKYAKFYVIKMCKYGTAEQRNYIIKSLYGHVKVLLRHATGSAVLETLYNEYANAQQRSGLVQEYYGPEFALFKDAETVYLKDALDKMDETKRKQILVHLKDELNELSNKTSLKLSISHFLFREFFKNAEANDRAELAQSLAENVAEILHTKDGSRVGLHCIWNGTAKERKVIIKSFKKLVASIAIEENGHFVLLGLFDSVDDTKLIEKSIIPELFDSANIQQILSSEYGRRVLMYLLCPRETKYFHPDIIKILQEGDSNVNSKKDKLMRQEELRQASLPYFTQLIQENCNSMADSEASLLILETLTHTKGEAYKQVAEILSSFLANKGKVQDGLEGPKCLGKRIEFLLKKVIKYEAELQKSASEKEPIFCKTFISELSKEAAESYTQFNRGCFILLHLLETEIPAVKKEVKSKLRDGKKNLFAKDSKGAELLCKKLD